MTALLTATGITRRFGGVSALQSVDASIRPKELFAIIGPNGAGKTTLLNILSGLDRQDGGTVLFDGKEVTGAKPWRNAKRGLARTLQTPVVFPRMSVLDNIVIGHAATHELSFVAALLRLRSVQRWRDAATEKAKDIATGLGLEAVADRTATELPLGLQRLVEIGRALATEPKLLMLDEPAAGLAKDEVTRLGQVLRRTVDDGIAVCLVEHNMGMVMGISERIMVLRQGQHLAEGTPTEIRRNPDVISAYLGSQSRQGADNAED